MNPGQRIIDAWIRRYQRRGGGLGTFRVDCNFTPTCSEYTRVAVLRFGVLRGLSLGFARIRRCSDRDCVHARPDPVPARLPAMCEGARRARAGNATTPADTRRAERH